jgi:hypothetical protein
LNSIKTTLTRKITEADPALDILGSDRKVLQVASQDFANYFKFSWKLGSGARDSEVTEMMEQFLKDECVEFESFSTVWVGIWLKKWKSRVKLLFGDQKQISSSQGSGAFANVEPIWEKLECKKELMEIVVSALIRNAEICGTEILAETLLKREFVKLNSPQVKEKMLVIVLNNALRSAREMAQKVGPLIFVKIDQAYFASQ